MRVPKMATQLENSKAIMYIILTKKSRLRRPLNLFVFEDSIAI